MIWRQNLPTKGTHPEESMWKILDEMRIGYDMNVPMTDGFTIYPREIDVLVAGVLAVEVQSSGKFFHDKPIRRRKDAAKKRSVEAMGLTYLEVWDDELMKADQVEAGKVWRPAIKSWISTMLLYAENRNRIFRQYLNSLPEPPRCFVPGIEGNVTLARRRD